MPHIPKALEALAKVLATFKGQAFGTPLRIQAPLSKEHGPVVQLEVTGCRDDSASVPQGGALDAVMSAQVALPDAGCPNRSGPGSNESVMASLIALNAQLLLYERGSQPVKDAA